MTTSNAKQEEWNEHDGSQMPVPANEIVQCRFRDGEEEVDGFQTAAFWNGMGVDSDSNWRWGPRKTPDDIVAYRLIRHPPTSKAKQSEAAEL